MGTVAMLAQAVVKCAIRLVPTSTTITTAISTYACIRGKRGAVASISTGAISTGPPLVS